MPDREDAPEKENGSGKKLAGLFQKKNLPITIVGTLLVVMLVVFAVGMAGQQRIASAAVLPAHPEPLPPPLRAPGLSPVCRRQAARTPKRAPDFRAAVRIPSARRPFRAARPTSRVLPAPPHPKRTLPLFLPATHLRETTPDTLFPAPRSAERKGILPPPRRTTSADPRYPGRNTIP